MKKFLSLLVALPIILAAGGTVPDGGFGSYDNGARDPIASSGRLLQWRWENAFTVDQKDYISLAVAKFDYDTRSLMLLWHASDYNIYFDHVNDPATPACNDPTASGCVLGWTYCQNWGENVGTNYRMCTLFRVKMYANNILARAKAKGYATEEDIGDMWQRVLYHEIAHAVGLRADVLQPTIGTGGQRLTECHKALLAGFKIEDDSSEWQFPAVPEACLPPPVIPE